jgi:hypothetical protein
MNFRGISSPANPALDGSSNSNQNDEYTAVLSMAGEYSALQGDFSASPFPTQSIPQGPSMALRNDQMATPVDSIQGSYGNQSQGLGFEDSLDSLAAFLDNDLLSSYHLSSLISTEQPMVYFSPESSANANDFMPHSAVQEAPHLTKNNDQSEEPNSFSRFGSPLPSLQPEERAAQTQQQTSINRPFSELSSEDRHNVRAKLADFASVVPPDFQLPSRLALSRYIAAYINGFHEHLPFLHLATMTIESCSLELILAMAAVGALKGRKALNYSMPANRSRLKESDVETPGSSALIDELAQKFLPRQEGQMGLQILKVLQLTVLHLVLWGCHSAMRARCLCDPVVGKRRSHSNRSSTADLDGHGNLGKTQGDSSRSPCYSKCACDPYTR